MNTRKLLAASLLGLGLALACVWLLGASLAAAAPTAIYNVTKLEDDDGSCDPTDCSLREAVIAANNDPGADVISLTVAGTYSLTIPGAIEVYAATGDLDIRDDLTILGQGPGVTIIDANSIDRVLYLNAGTVAISGVKIMGGAPPSGAGGGISSVNTDLSLTNVHVVSNTTTSYGGGVYVSSGSATLSGGQIADNDADYGGGVYVNGSTFTQSGASTITHNTATRGGGVYVSSGSATLSGGQIVNNTASEHGGGVSVDDGGAFTQTAGLIAHNVVTGTYYGGGVYIGEGRVNLSGGQVLGNRAVNGGGVYVSYGPATLVQTGDSAIVENTATLDGGGVFISMGSATLSGGQILSNTAGESGGGVCLYENFGAFTQMAGLIAYNTAEGTDADDGGGGIYSRFGTNQVTLSGGQILGNQAGRGGGLYLRAGNATMLGGQIVDNTAAHGGGVYAGTVGWTVPLEGGRIISNTATKNGGGLYAAAGTVTMERGQIVGNRADNEGGGIYHDTGGPPGVLSLINTTVSGNAADDGGGLYNASGTIVLTHTTVVSNRNGTGGRGIGAASPGSVLAKNTIVAYNTQGNCGTGVVTSNDHNLDDDTTCGFLEFNDKSGVDPQLPPLAYDKGTLVHAITPSSPAYNAGTCQADITTDQRGMPRIPLCDMGAYEYVHAQVFLPLVVRNY